MNYENDIRIDETALDVEWLEQAPLAMKYGRYYALAKRRLIEAEEKVKVTRAELIAEANADPEGCCNKKNPNAADIEAYYRMHKRHKQAKEEWVTAQYELDMAEIAKNEVSFTRKAALESLSQLYMSNYFAGPKGPRDLTKAREERKQKINAGIASHLTRTKK
jgi:hypothetical protein